VHPAFASVRYRVVTEPRPASGPVMRVPLPMAVAFNVRLPAGRWPLWTPGNLNLIGGPRELG
jgi:hypothetical protein